MITRQRAIVAAALRARFDDVATRIRRIAEERRYLFTALACCRLLLMPLLLPLMRDARATRAALLRRLRASACCRFDIAASVYAMTLRYYADVYAAPPPHDDYTP